MSDWEFGHFISDHSDQCEHCRHFRRGGGHPKSCDAFPDGIPDAIYWDGQDHRRPFSNDHGIRFEPLPGREHQPPLTADERNGTYFFGRVRFWRQDRWHVANLTCRGLWVCLDLPDVERLLDVECSEADLGGGYHRAGRLQLHRAAVLLGGTILRDGADLTD